MEFSTQTDTSSYHHHLGVDEEGPQPLRGIGSRIDASTSDGTLTHHDTIAGGHDTNMARDFTSSPLSRSTLSNSERNANTNAASPPGGLRRPPLSPYRNLSGSRKTSPKLSAAPSAPPQIASQHSDHHLYYTQGLSSDKMLIPASMVSPQHYPLPSTVAPSGGGGRGIPMPALQQHATPHQSKIAPSPYQQRPTTAAGGISTLLHPNTTNTPMGVRRNTHDVSDTRQASMRLGLEPRRMLDTEEDEAARRRMRADLQLHPIVKGVGVDKDVDAQGDDFTPPRQTQGVGTSPMQPPTDLMMVPMPTMRGRGNNNVERESVGTSPFQFGDTNTAATAVNKLTAHVGIPDDNDASALYSVSFSPTVSDVALVSHPQVDILRRKSVQISPPRIRGVSGGIRGVGETLERTPRKGGQRTQSTATVSEASDGEGGRGSRSPSGQRYGAQHHRSSDNVSHSDNSPLCSPRLHQQTSSPHMHYDDHPSPSPPRVSLSSKLEEQKRINARRRAELARLAYARLVGKAAAFVGCGAEEVDGDEDAKDTHVGSARDDGGDVVDQQRCARMSNAIDRLSRQFNTDDGTNSTNTNTHTITTLSPSDEHQHEEEEESSTLGSMYRILRGWEDAVAAVSAAAIGSPPSPPPFSSSTATLTSSRGAALKRHAAAKEYAHHRAMLRLFGTPTAAASNTAADATTAAYNNSSGAVHVADDSAAADGVCPLLSAHALGVAPLCEEEQDRLQSLMALLFAKQSKRLMRMPWRDGEREEEEAEGRLSSLAYRGPAGNNRSNTMGDTSSSDDDDANLPTTPPQLNPYLSGGGGGGEYIAARNAYPSAFAATAVVGAGGINTTPSPSRSYNATTLNSEAPQSLLHAWHLVSAPADDEDPFYYYRCDMLKASRHEEGGGHHRCLNASKTRPNNNHLRYRSSIPPADGSSFDLEGLEDGDHEDDSMLLYDVDVDGDGDDEWVDPHDELDAVLGGAAEYVDCSGRFAHVLNSNNSHASARGRRGGEGAGIVTGAMLLNGGPSPFLPYSTNAAATAAVNLKSTADVVNNKVSTTEDPPYFLAAKATPSSLGSAAPHQHSPVRLIAITGYPPEAPLPTLFESLEADYGIPCAAMYRTAGWGDGGSKGGDFSSAFGNPLAGTVFVWVPLCGDDDDDDDDVDADVDAARQRKAREHARITKSIVKKAHHSYADPTLLSQTEEAGVGGFGSSSPQQSWAGGGAGEAQDTLRAFRIMTNGRGNLSGALAEGTIKLRAPSWLAPLTGEETSSTALPSSPSFPSPSLTTFVDCLVCECTVVNAMAMAEALVAFSSSSSSGDDGFAQCFKKAQHNVHSEMVKACGDTKERSLSSVEDSHHAASLVARCSNPSAFLGLVGSHVHFIAANTLATRHAATRRKRMVAISPFDDTSSSPPLLPAVLPYLRALRKQASSDAKALAEGANALDVLMRAYLAIETDFKGEGEAERGNGGEGDGATGGGIAEGVVKAKAHHNAGPSSSGQNARDGFRSTSDDNMTAPSTTEGSTDSIAPEWGDAEVVEEVPRSVLSMMTDNDNNPSTTAVSSFTTVATGTSTSLLKPPRMGSTAVATDVEGGSTASMGAVRFFFDPREMLQKKQHAGDDGVAADQQQQQAQNSIPQQRSSSFPEEDTFSKNQQGEKKRILERLAIIFKIGVGAFNKRVESGLTKDDDDAVNAVEEGDAEALLFRLFQIIHRTEQLRVNLLEPIVDVLSDSKFV